MYSWQRSTRISANRSGSLTISMWQVSMPEPSLLQRRTEHTVRRQHDGDDQLVRGPAPTMITPRVSCMFV
jgi:hypothetical protein